MAASMAALKKDLRKNIRNILSDLSDAAVEAQSKFETLNVSLSMATANPRLAANAVKTLLATPEYKAAKRISVYLSMPSGEVSTSGIVHDALEQKKRVFIPYTYKPATAREGQPKSIMDMVELESLSDYEQLQLDNWGIPTPSQDSVSARANSFGGTGLTDGNGNNTRAESEGENGLDLIVMPGMAFDSSFGRLGHGKGFYDYFLHRCHQSSRLPFRVGLALTEQFLPPGQSVPMDSTDYRLDALILGNGEIRRAGP